MDPIDRLLVGRDLTTVQSADAFRSLFSELPDHSRFSSALLVLIQKKGVSTDELRGLVSLVRQMEPRRKISRVSYLADGCGTGGDGAHSFNISTIACLVAAGAGAHIAKHGNRGVSSHSGSADLLESLGVNIDAPFQRMAQALRRAGFGYFHAPNYHPLFKRAQPLRASLGRKGIKTIFNLTGPLVNPLRPPAQVIGVYRKDLVPVVAETAQKLGLKRVLVVWSQSGLDEFETARPSVAAILDRGNITQKRFSPFTFRLKRASARDWTSKNPAHNTKIAKQILSGAEQGPKRDLVLLNAAAILYASGRAKNIRQGIALARHSLESGAAQRSLDLLIKISLARQPRPSLRSRAR